MEITNNPYQKIINKLITSPKRQAAKAIQETDGITLINSLSWTLPLETLNILEYRQFSSILNDLYQNSPHISSIVQNRRFSCTLDYSNDLEIFRVYGCFHDIDNGEKFNRCISDMSAYTGTDLCRHMIDNIGLSIVLV